jgi:hypothetical protein
MYGAALHLLLDKDQKRIAAALGYYRNCALAEEPVEDDLVAGEFKKDAWKRAEHRGRKEEHILDKAREFLIAKKKLEKRLDIS